MSANKSAKRILIVEDDDIQKIVMERLVTKLGHTVIGKSSHGSKAIESALRIGTVDLILMDINLADNIDGIEAAKEISKHKEVKLIYVTSDEDPLYRKRAEETNYVAYLTKPLEMTTLEQAFKKAFSTPSVN